MLTQEYLKFLIHYDEETGVFRRHVNKTKIRSYHVVISNVTYRLKHLAWLYVYGSFPDRMIKCIDGNEKNTAIKNLVLVDDFQLAQIHKIKINNTSGVTGVSWYAKDKTWRATITVNRKRIDLGSSVNLEKAIALRKAGEEKYHTFKTEWEKMKGQS